MILVDYRKGAEKGDKNTPQEFVQHILQLGVSAQLADLEFGDFAFEGNGPDGYMMVGIERKTLHDMLNCIDDARFAAHQRLGMKSMYPVSVLMLEGYWKPHDPQLILMEGFNGGTTWGYCRYRSRTTMYNKLYRYMISMQLGGVLVSYSRDVKHTAINVVEYYQYFQKKWDDHTSLREIHKVAIPTLHLKPSLLLKWANAIDGVGVKFAEQAARIFKTPHHMANSEELDWMRVKGIGAPTAQDIMRQIWGKK